MLFKASPKTALSSHHDSSELLLDVGFVSVADSGLSYNLLSMARTGRNETGRDGK